MKALRKNQDKPKSPYCVRPFFMPVAGTSGAMAGVGVLGVRAFDGNLVVAVILFLAVALIAFLAVALIAFLAVTLIVFLVVIRFPSWLEL